MGMRGVHGHEGGSMGMKGGFMRHEGGFHGDEGGPQPFIPFKGKVFEKWEKKCPTHHSTMASPSTKYLTAPACQQQS